MTCGATTKCGISTATRRFFPRRASAESTTLPPLPRGETRRDERARERHEVVEREALLHDGMTLTDHAYEAVGYEILRAEPARRIGVAELADDAHGEIETTLREVGVGLRVEVDDAHVDVRRLDPQAVQEAREEHELHVVIRGDAKLARREPWLERRRRRDEAADVLESALEPIGRMTNAALA